MSDASSGLPVNPHARPSPTTMVAGGRAGTDESRRVVVVPRRPSLLREYTAAPRRQRDELDEFIDELFGATTDEQPGRFDALLVIVGLVLMAWAAILGGPAPAVWLGTGAIVLGVALPLRTALRRYGSQRTGDLGRRLFDGGQLLDASHPATIALIDAYAQLIQMSCLQGTGDPKRAVAAGHMAVVEVATYLDGHPPEGPAKVRFVSVRTEAIEALSRQMMRSHDRWLAKTGTVPTNAEGSGVDPAGTSQFEPLNALARSGAVSELEKLNHQLRRETADAAG